MDAQTKEPVSGASVVVIDYPRTAEISGESGEFEIGPGRKWYWYFTIGFHNHILPEQTWPKLSNGVEISHTNYVSTTQFAPGAARDRSTTKQRYELGDVVLERK